MNKSRQRKSTIFLLVAFIIIYVSISVYKLVDADRTHKGVMNWEKIDSITMLMESVNSSNKTIRIFSDSVLKKINRSFQYLEGFTPNSPKVHTILIDLDIYKKRKFSLTLLKTSYSGWVISIYDDWYKDDSLIAILEPELNIKPATSSPTSSSHTHTPPYPPSSPASPPPEISDNTSSPSPHPSTPSHRSARTHTAPSGL